MQMYYIGLDVHKKTVSYCIKEAGGQILREGTIGATRSELYAWMKTLCGSRNLNQRVVCCE